MPLGSGNLKGTAAMNEGDGQIAQGGHELRSRARAQAGVIFAKGGIPHIMQAVLNRLKLIKRMMYGRARIPLLRQRVLHVA